MSKISAIAKTSSSSTRKNATDFPSGVRDNAYIDRIKQCYPIHPELFDRLYEDWSTLERFQRTRGVLRVMNQIVGSLWRDQDKAPLILPGCSVGKSGFRRRIRYYLDENWHPIIDGDVAGQTSVPFQVDKNNDVFGKRGDAQRLARAIFMAATPTLHTAHKVSTNRGSSSAQPFPVTPRATSIPPSTTSPTDPLTSTPRRRAIGTTRRRTPRAQHVTTLRTFATPTSGSRQTARRCPKGVAGHDIRCRTRMPLLVGRGPRRAEHAPGDRADALCALCPLYLR